MAKSKKSAKKQNSPDFDAKDGGPSFLISEARAAFNGLRLAFTKALILWYFDPECHIQIKTDASGYTIGHILSQLVSGTRPDGIIIKTNLGQWHLVVFFSMKMISAETQYETHNGKLLAVIKVLKTWRHYLEGCKHEVFILRDYNNFRCFMDMKN